MNSLEGYLQWVSTRLASSDDPREEADLELKSNYPQGVAEKEAVWMLADLLASLANDARIDGFRALVYGPAENLHRPAWLKDESQLRDKLLHHFDGAVVPGVELVRREITGRGVVDAFVVVERDSPPFVTRMKVGGPWVVRVRTNTARRTATRAELLALAKSGKAPTKPVRLLRAHAAALGRGTKTIVVTNVGTLPVKEIKLTIPDGAESAAFDPEAVIDLLNPGEQDSFPILAPGGHSGSSVTSERLTVAGIAVDGEPVQATVLVSAFG